MLAAQVIADSLGGAVAEFHVAAHRIAAQVEVAVLHAQLISPIGFIFDGKRRRLGGIEHFEFIDDDFDFAGWNLQVLAFAFTHQTAHFHHEFAPEFRSFFH